MKEKEMINKKINKVIKCISMISIILSLTSQYANAESKYDIDYRTSNNYQNKLSTQLKSIMGDRWHQEIKYVKRESKDILMAKENRLRTSDYPVYFD